LRKRKDSTFRGGRTRLQPLSITSTLYGTGGVLEEYEEPSNPISWLSRCKRFFNDSYEALQLKRHGVGEEEEEDETDFEKFLNETFPKTKMGKKRKKSRQTESVFVRRWTIFSSRVFPHQCSCSSQAPQIRFLLTPHHYSTARQ
jgi:hypothetical protein